MWRRTESNAGGGGSDGGRGGGGGGGGVGGAGGRQCNGVARCGTKNYDWCGDILAHEVEAVRNYKSNCKL